MEYRINTAANKFHQIDIYECPIELLEELAKETNVDVTVENLYPIRIIDEWFESDQALYPNGKVDNFKIRNAVFDVFLTNSQFIENMKFWNSNGVYAVFTERSPIPFKASNLEAPSRYNALSNFGFKMEFSLASASSDGWSRIVTPDEELIKLAENFLNGKD